MDAFSLFTAAETRPFGIALGLLLGITIIEGIGVFLAASPSTWLDGLLSGKDLTAGSLLEGPLGWLHVGKVPLLVLLILFLTAFGLSGYVLQLFVRGVFGGYAPGAVAAIPATLVGLSTVRGLGALIARIVPRDETTALSEQTLIGRAGVLIGGTARTGLAGQVRVRDVHGRAHYLMVEPDLPDEEFPDGTTVLIVKKVGATYRGIRNPHPDLL